MKVFLIRKGNRMDQMQESKSQYQKACIVIVGDCMEDWKYVFRELRMRVGVSNFFAIPFGLFSTRVNELCST